MKKEEYEIVNNTWLKASEIFNFEFISPYTINVGSSIVETFAFLPQYGSTNGIVICLFDYIKDGAIFPDNSIVVKYAKQNSIMLSQVCYKQFLEFEKNIFNELLDDWGRFN